MPPRITEVQWGYTGRLPSGISFKEETGTFSGTPTKAGEYTIPVTVWTDYGTDTKDVKIVVKTAEPEFYRIKLSGRVPIDWEKNISVWSESVENLDVVKVVPNGDGFFLQLKTEEWYQCKYNSLSPTGVTELPVSNVIDVAYGITIMSSNTYIYTAYLTSNNDCIINMIHKYKQGSENKSATSTTTFNNIKKLQVGVGEVVSMITLDNKMCGISYMFNSFSTSVFPFENIKSFAAQSSLNSNPPNRFILTSDGELYGDTNNGWQQEMKDIGRIKDFWLPQRNLAPSTGGDGGACLFVLTEDNSLYFWTVNATGLIGTYTTKNIIGSHMLTEDGTIYNLDTSSPLRVLVSEDYQDTALKDISYVGIYSIPDRYEMQIALY